MSAIRISSGFALAVICMSVMAVVSCSRLEYGRILDNGKSAEAKILKFEYTGSSFNDMPEIKFYLEVYPPSGSSFRTETIAAVPSMSAPALQPGNRVKVKYMPDTNKVAIVGTR